LNVLAKLLLQPIILILVHISITTGGGVENIMDIILKVALMLLLMILIYRLIQKASRIVALILWIRGLMYHLILKVVLIKILSMEYKCTQIYILITNQVEIYYEKKYLVINYEYM